MAESLKASMEKKASDNLEQFNRDRDSNLEVAKCKLIAETDAEVRAVQREIDQQLEDEKKQAEDAMKLRLQALKKEREQELDKKKQELLKLRSSDMGR
mmetsp:Transcript_5019/g.7545  ORF Transcript_5019/g.7545 Transcript_5019/m.7545 type:complete len:98 (+) Transcript_5019:7967-8260(+)